MEIFAEVVKEVSVTRIRTHIEALQGERHPVSSPDALDRAAAYIESHLESLGYELSNYCFEDGGRTFRNVIGSREGEGDCEERLLVAAHFDTVEGSPGADDNASGIAVMLELATVLNPYRFRRTIHFVGLNLEECAGLDPESGTRGSQALAGFAYDQGWKIAGVVVLESVAYAGDSVGQCAPVGIPFEVSEVGNFIAIIGNEDSIGLLINFARVIDQNQVPLPYVVMAVPGRGESLPDTRRSDHAPFWDNGFKAVMVTDTTNFRSPHYHKASDTIDTLNLGFAAEVCRATAGLVLEVGQVVQHQEDSGLPE